MSTVVMAACWPLKLSSASKAVLISLADNANDAGVCWPSVATICTRTCLHRTTIMRAILDLERRGILVIDHSNGRHNTYRLTVDSYPQPVAQRDRSHSATGSVERPDQSHSATPPVAQRDTNRHLTVRNHQDARARDGEPLEAAPSALAGNRSPEQRASGLRHLAGLLRQVHPPDPADEAVRAELATKPPIPIPTDTEDEHVQAAQA